MYASLVARNGGFLLTVVSGNDCLQFGQPNILELNLISQARV